jgi:hypothetical protein
MILPGLTPAEWLTLAGQAMVFITALVAAVQGIFNRAAIQEVHLTVNSRLDEFKSTLEALTQTKVAAAHAQGLLQGKAEGHNGHPAEPT